MRKKDMQVGDKVRLTNDQDGLKKGSEGIIRKIVDACAYIEVTKNVNNCTLHACSKTFTKNIGYIVHYSNMEVIEEVKPEKKLECIDLDFGDLCSNSIDDFLKNR